MPGEKKSLIEIYEENIRGIQANLDKGEGSPRRQEFRRCALARLKLKLELARSGQPITTYAEKTARQRRESDRHYAIW